MRACALKTGESITMPPAWMRQRPPWTGCGLTTVDVLSLLVASLCPLGGTVFALVRLAEAERMRHLEVFPVHRALACLLTYAAVAWARCGCEPCGA
jgi:hypothetical protein